MENEIVIKDGKKYELIKTKCDCLCHRQKGVRHISACCNDGWVETYWPITEKEIKDGKETR